MKEAICGLSRITDKPHSHTRGWAQLWADNLEVPVNHDCEIVDVAYLECGVNWSGSLNVMGGWNEAWQYRLEQLCESKHIVSLDIPMPKLSDMIEARKDVIDKKPLEKLRRLEAESKTLCSLDLPYKHLTIGDSHTGAVAPYESCIVRANGKTLNGQLRRDFSYVRDALEQRPDLERLTLCFSSIDLRFHLLRLNADWREMWRQYKAFGDSLSLDVEYAIPFPVEFEGRRLPKTGQYKGQNFYGTQQQRAGLLEDIVSFTDEIGMNVVHYPAEWRKMDPEEYAKTRMEKPQSVHLSPMFYRRMSWGQ